MANLQSVELIRILKSPRRRMEDDMEPTWVRYSGRSGTVALGKQCVPALKKWIFLTMESPLNVVGGDEEESGGARA